MILPHAYLNGEWIGHDQMAVSIADAGFVLGATATEQLRTFGGQLFRLQQHLDRLFRSLDILRIDLDLTPEKLSEIARQSAEKNWERLDEGDDLGLGIFVTPGDYPLLGDGSPSEPTICVYAYTLPFDLWANKFQQGDRLIISDVAQVSPRSWPPELKCRSRVHYYLADKKARAIDPGAHAVLLDEAGYVCEASTANVAIYREAEGLVAPPRTRILPGISLAVLNELAAAVGIPTVQRDFRPKELVAADEVLLTSTSVCVLPVVQVDGKAIGAGQPGEVYRRLLKAWNELVGVDIAEQAVRFSKREKK